MESINEHEAKTGLLPMRREPGISRQQPGWEDFVFDPHLFAPMSDGELVQEGWSV
jgi:hypothetical protein